MQKDELIQIHTFLLQLRTHLEDLIEDNGSCSFQTYEKLDVSPFQVYKSKREHKLAVFKLCQGMANLLSDNNCPGLEKIARRLEMMSERFMTNKEREIIGI